MSASYNYTFNKVNGVFARWGNLKQEDPLYAPFGPEIADIEVTTSCNGINGVVCSFCYKANTPQGQYMSFETYKHIIDIYPDVLTQVAFGVDSQCKTNPDIWKIMTYTREKGVIPNVTVAQIDDDTAYNLASLCGAVAVSRYKEKEVCYSSVKKLTDLGMNQVNIHFMLSEETYEDALITLNDISSREELEKLNAIVFLSLKQKGRGEFFTPLTLEHYTTIVNLCFQKEIAFGMDSCGAYKFLQATNIIDPTRVPQVAPMVESCESGLFSTYINVEGKFFPCSFSEGIGEWEEGIDLMEINSQEEFLDKLWYGERVMKWRKNLLNSMSKEFSDCRICPIYEV
jgi:hypothetical protein